MAHRQSKVQLKLPGLGKSEHDFESVFQNCEQMMLKHKCLHFRPAQFPSSRPQDQFNGYCRFWITARGDSKEQRQKRKQQEVSIHDVGACPLMQANRLQRD